MAGVAEWHINADEPAVLDYNTDYKSAGQIAACMPVIHPVRADDDPTIIGLDLVTAAVGTPAAAPTATTQCPAEGTPPDASGIGLPAVVATLLMALVAAAAILLVRRRRHAAERDGAIREDTSVSRGDNAGDDRNVE